MRIPPFDVDPVGSQSGPMEASAEVPAELLGAWSATRWEYTDARAEWRHVDLVCDLGSMVTMSISPDSWVLTFVVPGLGTRSVGGTHAADEGALRLGVAGGEPVVLNYRISGDALSWNDANSAWDFDGDGREEPASLVAVFVRI